MALSSAEQDLRDLRTHVNVCTAMLTDRLKPESIEGESALQCAVLRLLHDHHALGTAFDSKDRSIRHGDRQITDLRARLAAAEGKLAASAQSETDLAAQLMSYRSELDVNRLKHQEALRKAERFRVRLADAEEQLMLRRIEVETLEAERNAILPHLNGFEGGGPTIAGRVSHLVSEHHTANHRWKQAEEKLARTDAIAERAREAEAVLEQLTTLLNGVDCGPVVGADLQTRVRVLLDRAEKAGTGEVAQADAAEREALRLNLDACGQMAHDRNPEDPVKRWPALSGHLRPGTAEVAKLVRDLHAAHSALAAITVYSAKAFGVKVELPPRTSEQPSAPAAEKQTPAT